jgi:Zn-dependent protease/CBS domain-containing protein
MASWRFGRVAGIELKVHVSFLLIVLLGAIQWNDFGARGALFGAVLMLLTFASVTLHELGHSLVARAFGIPVKDITLYPIGGVARLGRRPKTALQELLIALAGPAVNVGLFFGLGALGVALFGRQALVEAWLTQRLQEPTIETLVAMLVVSNAALALFNMVPALPMDGGRVLRAVLTWLVGAERATSWSAVVARVLAVGLFGLGVFANPMLCLIALFVLSGAGQEVRVQRLGTVLDGVALGDVVSPYAPRFTPATTLGEAVRTLTMTHFEAIAVEHFGRLLGVVTQKDLLRAARAQGASGYVAGVMRRDVPTLDSRDTLEGARFKMEETGLPYAAIMRSDGLFLGLVTERELAVVADRLAQARFQGGAEARAGFPRRT